MRVKKLALAMSLMAGLGLLATRAEAGFAAKFLEGTFDIVNDANDPNANNCFIESDFGFFEAGGTVTGTGNGVLVDITYSNLEPTSVSHSTTKINVKQSQWSLINFRFGGVSATGDVQIEKGNVNGSYNSKNGKGTVSASFKGTDLFNLLTANQVAIVQAAFNGRKDVKVKVNTNAQKGSLSISCKGVNLD